MKLNAVKENNLTLRQVAMEETTRRCLWAHMMKVADQIIEWIDNDGADGFVLTPHILGDFFHDFIDKVIPILVARGYYDTSWKTDFKR